MRILGIDPGPIRSAWVVYDSEDQRIVDAAAATLNRELLELCRNGWVAPHRVDGSPRLDLAVIEKVEHYGATVGADVFETVYWSGRFAEAVHPLPVERLPRRRVKLHLCGTSRAKDPNVRAALLERYGSGAVGTKAEPGPLYGIHGDLWAALAVAVTYCDQRAELEAAQARSVG